MARSLAISRISHTTLYRSSAETPGLANFSADASSEANGPDAFADVGVGAPEAGVSAKGVAITNTGGRRPLKAADATEARVLMFKIAPDSP